MFVQIRCCIKIFGIGLLLTMINCTRNQKITSVDDYPSDIDQYEFLRYSGGQEVISPDRVVNADNNWDILLACLGGKTWTELKKAGVNATESQLMLLNAMRFIDYKEELKSDTITTTLPILGRNKKQLLIREVREFAEQIEPELREDIQNLKKTLTGNGYEDCIFSVLFSCVVDGLVWFPFRAQGLVSEFTLSEQRPLFDGVYWSYYPKRDFRCGTNIALGENIFIIVNWSDGPQEKIQKVFNWKNLRSMHDQLVQSGRIVEEDLKQQLMPYRVIEQNGKPIVPVIEMKMDDPVFSVCQAMAAKIVRFMAGHLDLDRIRTEYGFPDKETAFVVVYHEWMWEFMEYLVEKGIVEKPEAFERPEEAEAGDIGKLLFIVKGSVDR
jgi:hypothetical protein